LGELALFFGWFNSKGLIGSVLALFFGAYRI